MRNVWRVCAGVAWLWSAACPLAVNVSVLMKPAIPVVPLIV